MTDLKNRFLNFIEEQKLFSRNDPVLLAVSGGIDSAVMSHLFHQCGLKFGIAHVNFQLRGKESEEDEAFVHSLAEQMNVKFFLTRFNTNEFAAEKKISVQMAARELRYGWLEQMRKENGFHRIAVAHHFDDSIETVFINMFRGTGIQGLKGIPPVNDKIVRPLLCFYKEELQNFAEENLISFREDSSNMMVDYDRNKIRLEIIPSIEKNFPAFKKVFVENISKWKDAALLYDEAMKLYRKKLLEQHKNEFRISIQKLKLLPAHKTILFELLKDFGFNSDQVSLIAESFESESGKNFLSATHRLIKDRKHLIISPIGTPSVSETLIQEDDRQIRAGNFVLQISERKTNEFSVPKDSAISCLDKKELEFPLVLRKWKKGDYFYPFGMKKKKKKISDYLIDRKIPLSEKENIWVIESNRRIACIVGERIDERFKVAASTEIVVVIEKK
ncbi:MAG: tRNA lysidine(34) synthetase TilS [Chitinophagales bacterium]